MELIVDPDHRGTPEPAWLASRRLTACPALTWGPIRRAVVLAPHPDDEVLGVGGTMRQLARAGAELAIVAITDGEASHPRSPTTPPTQLAIRRAEERRRALRLLGVMADVVRLGVPDGGVARASDLAQRLIPLVCSADWCLAPWERDGHPDHDAAGIAAVRACAATGVRIVRYPIWAWHWATPDGDELPWRGARRVELAADDLAAKHAAIAAYRSQLAPLSRAAGDEAILPGHVVSHFQRPFELVFV
jgi:LmbE family N-acetylglucosaminyl deacetylase